MRDLVTDIAPEMGCGAALLTARGLGYAVGGQPILRGIDLRIGKGRRTLVMGANGAGKSVLLRLLHGLLPPSSGTVVWHGAPRAQAMVFQRPVMLRRSVLGNLRFALGVHGWRGRAREEKAAEALEMARLTARARQPARLLSGGEQQRLAVARALACDPEVLFLDEPTNSLDPVSTQMIEDLVNAAHARGVTIVMVTHDLGQARRMGDEVSFSTPGVSRNAARSIRFWARRALRPPAPGRRGGFIPRHPTNPKPKRSLQCSDVTFFRLPLARHWPLGPLPHRRRTRSSWCNPPPRRRIPGCSITSCRSLSRNPESTCAWWR